MTTKQQRYMDGLCNRIMSVIESKPRTAFDKTRITSALGLKSDANVRTALGLLYKRDRIARYSAGCRNAAGLHSASAMYVSK